MSPGWLKGLFMALFLTRLCAPRAQGSPSGSPLCPSSLVNAGSVSSSALRAGCGFEAKAPTSVMGSKLLGVALRGRPECRLLLTSGVFLPLPVAHSAHLAVQLCHPTGPAAGLLLCVPAAFQPQLTANPRTPSWTGCPS